MRAHQQKVEPDDVGCGHWLAAGLGAPQHLRCSAITFRIQQSILALRVFLGHTHTHSVNGCTCSHCLSLSLTVPVHGSGRGHDAH